jgi:hypothetical protein
MRKVLIKFDEECARLLFPLQLVDTIIEIEDKVIWRVIIKK